MSGRKKHRTANEYLHYLKGELSNQERHSFEKELEADPFEKEALEGLETITPDQAEEDILSLHTRLNKRIGKRRRIAWYSAAASIASLLIIGTVFMQIYDFNPEVAEEKFVEEEFTPTQSEMTESPGPDDKIDEEAKAPKGQLPDPAKERSKGPSKDPTPATEVQVLEATKAEVAVSEAMVYVTPVSKAAVSETPINKAQESGVTIEEDISEDFEPERITYVEAEPDAEVAENRDQKEENGRRSKKRSDHSNQPTTNREVSGMVISGEDLEPLPGAAVAMKGSSTGVVTEIDGSFTLPLQDDSSSTLVASFVGMETREYNFEEGEELHLVMQPDAMMLNEVVVVEQQTAPQGNIRTAQPAVGFPAFKEYIKENIRFPEVEAAADRVVVVLKFTVSPTGAIININPLRSPGEPFTLEAIRLIREGPTWNPATGENGNIDDIVRVRIVFKK